jgi:hypothetical protein
MTITSQSVPAAGGISGDNAGTDETAGGGIERVNAFDGLFLRALHLNKMQDYALELATALGVAGGPGVVYGFGVSIGAGDLINIEPGLAIGPQGRVLKSERVMTLSLGDLKPSGDDFWWVEINNLDWAYGDEAVQGLLCDEPCGPGTTIRGTRAEGVATRLVADSRVGLGGTTAERKRNWLASRLFELEEVQAKAWPGAASAKLAGRNWDPLPVPLGADQGIRLAIVIPDDSSGWQLDVWAARRDRCAPPPVPTWQWRLSMRPWDVFIAQILQFQALLDVRLNSASGAAIGYINDLLIRLQDVREHLDPQAKITKQESAEEIASIEQDINTGGLGLRLRTGGKDASLRSIGIDELPPGGFLPVTSTGDGVGEEVMRLLGGDQVVHVRVCHGDLSDVGGFLERAQHRDRIRLDTGVLQPVDILVPRTTDGGTQLDWVAFARGDTVDCGEGADPGQPTVGEPVTVYLLNESDDENLFEAYLQYLKQPKGTPPDLPKSPGLELRYPTRMWALPDDPMYADLVGKIQGIETGQNVVFVSVVSDSERRPLGGLRAWLLATQVTEQRSMGIDIDVRTLVRPGAEAIVVLNPNQLN